MKVIKIEKTETSPAVISVSWFNSKGVPFGYFVQGNKDTTMEELEEQMASEFFYVFQEITKEYEA